MTTLYPQSPKKALSIKAPREVFAVLFALRVLVSFLSSQSLGFAAGAAVIGFDATIEIAHIHPQVAPVSNVYNFSAYGHPQSNKWVFFNWGRSGRLIFDNDTAIQTESSVRPDAQGKAVTRNSATLHCVYKGIPLTLDRVWYAAWFAYAAERAIRSNEGMPFPNAHGNVLYDLNSKCCTIATEWPDNIAVSPMRALFRHDNNAAEFLSRFSTKEELSDDPAANEAMRANYGRLSTNGTLVAEFTVTKWARIGDYSVPEHWHKEIFLLGTPSLRISGSATQFKEIPELEMRKAMLYDASEFDSVRDYRLLGLDNVDYIAYSMRGGDSKQVLPTNDVLITQLLTQKQADTAAMQRAAREKPAPITRVLIIALFLIALGSPLLWRLRPKC